MAPVLFLNRKLEKKLTYTSAPAPITVAARSKAWNIFARSNTGIVVSNPAQGMDVCLRLFCVCVVLCRSRPCVGQIPCSRSPTDCLRLRNWSEMKRFTDAICSKWAQQEVDSAPACNSIVNGYLGLSLQEEHIFFLIFSVTCPMGETGWDGRLFVNTHGW
jgi:hypothetical protein